MDPNAKKTALRMIPYGLYVLTAARGDKVAAATVNWVTQASFEPPLVAVGVKTDSHAHALIKETRAFALNVLGKGQGAPAYVECRLVGTVEKGDHSVFVGEVVDAGVSKEPAGRADDATLWLKELGDKVFYGG